jgi:hypothetical protein
MDKLFALLSIDTAASILSGVDFKVDTLDEKKLNAAMVCGLHCILNGPVGVNKDTTFPIIGDGSIRGLVSGELTNRTWKKLCMQIAKHIKNKLGWSDVINSCNQFAMKGDIWPINDSLSI